MLSKARANCHLQVVTAAREFLDRYSKLPPFEQREELKSLETSITEADVGVRQATVLKIEAMLIHAGKTKLKKTQKDLIESQMAEVASVDFLEDSLFQPALWKWAKGHLT